VQLGGSDSVGKYCDTEQNVIRRMVVAHYALTVPLISQAVATSLAKQKVVRLGLILNEKLSFSCFSFSFGLNGLD